ncbi:MAG: ORF6N domain-containing protein [Verrucomicrobia bacterium]|nr:ORF6N domain-containing protein [Verrucomicrobiota bacterium]
MSEDASIIPIERVEQSIYLIRGHKVMLDRDLAGLYGVETRVLNQAVKRNAERFPADFMFELTREEIRNISQFVICSTLKHAPKVFAFTEQGVAMLSGVLKSPRAVEVNIAIMRTFVKLRRMLESNEVLARKLAELESRYDEQFRVVFEAINELMIPPEPKNNPIGFHVREDSGVYTVRKIS